MADDQRRLIEVAFPLKEASLDSVHEKNVRHGHISTLHIWPARRPLAASRAALIATLLPDPGNAAARKQMLEKLGGRLVTKVKKKKLSDGRTEEQQSEETEGGILHWGRESSADLDWFREQIRAAYGGRAPRVLDPFAGGGAIPLEAMRLGCDVTAVDINPVAWFILKCTLEYPQRLAGQLRQLPDFALHSREFMEAYQTIWIDGTQKDSAMWIDGYQAAVRANRQLAVVLQAQGLNEDAARFAYRAQKLQRIVWRRQHKFLQYLFSLFLDLLAGYGYKPIRSLLWYLIVIVGFAIAYYAIGHLPFFPDSFVFSLTSFHGRGFFPGFGSGTTLHNPLVVLAAFEAVIGLFIEISFIATFTQRFFGK